MTVVVQRLRLYQYCDRCCTETEVVSVLLPLLHSHYYTILPSLALLASAHPVRSDVFIALEDWEAVKPLVSLWFC